MHTEILTGNQVELLPYIKKFNRSFYLVGGTAIALHIGHRRSVDFDLFTKSRVNKSRIKAELFKIPFNKTIIFEDYDQLHFIINNVKVTFFSYPYPVLHHVKIDTIINMPSLLSLSAMKAFAFGRRAKWKDYVDMYFLLKDSYTVSEISLEAENIYGELFSEKLFREQLAFHDDIDYSEPVEYLGSDVSESVIKEFLINKATDIY